MFDACLAVVQPVATTYAQACVRHPSMQTLNINRNGAGPEVHSEATSEETAQLAQETHVQ